MNYLLEHPFTIVAIVTIIFMTLISIEDYRAVKHNKRRKEIEKKKKERTLLNERKKL